MRQVKQNIALKIVPLPTVHIMYPLNMWIIELEKPEWQDSEYRKELMG